MRALPSYASVRETVVVSPQGREISLLLPDGNGEFAGVVPRRELDAALVRLARARGVDVRDGTGLRSLTPAHDHFDAELDDGSVLSASWVIGADGHYSATRRLVQGHGRAHEGDPPDLGTWHAFRQYFRNVDDERLWVLFEKDLLPEYAWVFPIGGGRANVGFGVLRRDVTSGKQLARLWRDVIERPSVRRVLGPRAGARRPAPRVADPRIVE